MEITGFNLYDIKTVEVNNPENCNLKSFHMQRKNILEEYLDEKTLDSILVKNNQIPIIDLTYLQKFKNNGNLSDADKKKTYMLEFLFKQTKNGFKPGSCELRAFAKIIS
jgi:hypothetical protein